MNEEVCRDMTGEADGTVLKSRYGRIQCRDLVREGKVFIKDKAKVASRGGCSERRVVNFRKLLFKSDKKKLSFRKVESKKVCSHTGRDLL